MLLASCYHSRGYNFEVATRFLENFLHLVYAAELLRVDPYCSEIIITEFHCFTVHFVSQSFNCTNLCTCF